MALWASAAWQLMLETTDVKEMFYKTGSAMTRAGARDDAGRLYDERINLEGVDTEEMKKMRPLLTQKPAPMSFKTVFDMLMKLTSADLLLAECIK